MKRCPRCALPEVFPGIEFHEDGICNYCIYYDIFEERLRVFKKKLREEFENVVAEAKQRRDGYHCILCYSGGKDSTFLLHLLKTRYELNILAYTLDNGFISPQAFRNIAEVVGRLGVDHIFFRPRSSTTRKIFREALTNNELFSKSLLPYANQCCLSCIAMVLSIALKMGQEKNIPLVVIGFTPGQAAEVGIESFMKTGSTMFFAHEVNRDDPVDFPKVIRDPIYEVVGEEIDQYLIKSQYLEEGEKYPRVLYPYHAMIEYDEKEIYETIAQYGWVAPKDTDACSTNCRLNSVAIASHVNKRGYHPYIAEMSCLVREGKMSYEEAVAREKTLASAGVIQDVLGKLGLTPADIGFVPKEV
jgi:tRNA(Ile)-lysidine synthase TilS/MesJ